MFEHAARVGGHANTVEASMDGVQYPVDTGFIVYNEVNYPNLVALFDHLEVPTHPSDMSFAVSAARTSCRSRSFSMRLREKRGK